MTAIGLQVPSRHPPVRPLDARSGPLEVDNVGGKLDGGSAGYAVRGNVNIDWTGVDTGERIGSIA